MKGPGPLLGAHMSIAGGLDLAVEEGARLGCTAVQIFTKNPSQWRERILSAGEIDVFRRAVSRSNIRSVISHGGYLCNLASPEVLLRKKSVDALVAEVKRSALLGLSRVVIHPGSHGGTGEEAGLARIAEGIKEVIRRTGDSDVMILLENTAGQGTSLGHRFGQIGLLLSEAGFPSRLGACFDTSHAFAAGYDLRTPESYRRTMKQLDEAVGLDRVLAIHLNDAKKPLGSKVDRHEHIGMGHIGRRAFGLIMKDNAIQNVPKLLETPKTRCGKQMDPVNLALLWRLAGQRGGR